MRYILALVLLTPWAAFAQAPQPAPLPATTISSQITDTCDAWRSKAAQNAEGTTTLAVDVKLDGTTANARMLQSSGNADLDQASLNCLKAAHLKPATEHGEPIEVTREFDIHWVTNIRSSISFTRLPATELTPTSCRGHVTNMPHHPTPTIVSFQIAPDGSTRDAVITQSSGSDGLDKAAVECVLSAFHYMPAWQNGNAVQIDWKVEIPWTMR